MFSVILRHATALLVRFEPVLHPKLRLILVEINPTNEVRQRCLSSHQVNNHSMCWSNEAYSLSWAIVEVILHNLHLYFAIFLCICDIYLITDIKFVGNEQIFAVTNYRG